MGGSIPSLLSSDAASCIAVAELMIALGTQDGTVHILDFLGNQVKEFHAHSATVNDLSFDLDGEYIGSCLDDGSVVINSLFTDEKMKFDYHRPSKAIALDPDYARKSSRRFVAGGLTCNLYYNTKKWLGYRDQLQFHYRSLSRQQAQQQAWLQKRRYHIHLTSICPATLELFKL